MADLPCVILAGGLARRMLPHTAEQPKILLPVAGEPFAVHQLRWLASQGVGQVVIAIGHLGEMVETAIGDGRSFGLDVSYSHDGDQPLGTGGALREAIDARGLDGPVLVTYGDSLLSLDVDDVVAHYERRGRPAVMVVYRNRNELDASNASFDGSLVTYRKGTRDPLAAGLDQIDYGLSIFEASVVRDHVSAGQPFDLAELQTDLSRHGQLAGYQASDRFYEIGSPAGLAELEQHLSARRDSG